MYRNSIKQLILTLVLLFSVALIGTTGYFMMGYSLTESVYQTIITMTTVGFEEVHPLSNTGMWFTSGLVIVSFGIYVYAVAMFTRHLIEGVLRNYYRDNKVKRKISRMQDHVIICGYGRNGRQATIELSEHQVPVVIIEKDPEIIQGLRQQSGVVYVEGDAASEEVLKEANITGARAMITTLPIDADNLFVVLTARELNPDLKVISRASIESSDPKLKRAGADNVIMPDRIGGQRMAKLVAQPDVVEFIELILLQSNKSVVLEEISCARMENCFEGKELGILERLSEQDAKVIGLKRDDNSYVINPPPQTILKRSDKLFALGTRKQIDLLIKNMNLPRP